MREWIFTIPAYTGHAKDGIVTRAHLGLVGEAGPEAIIPLSKARGLGHHVSIDYHPTIHAGGADANFR